MNKRVLIVEDNEVISKLQICTLEHNGFTTEHAKDGDEALLRIIDTDFDGIITDLFMPNMDGMQFIDALIAKSVSVPIIVVTGSTNNDIISKLKQKGINNIFLKPLDENDYGNIFSLIEAG